MIHLTEKAALKIKEIADGEGVGHYIIRVKTIGGGCGGMSYDMNFDNNISETDEQFELDDVKVICDYLSLQYLDEVVIDWLETPIDSGFKFNNPNKRSCGCGSSFEV